MKDQETQHEYTLGKIAWDLEFWLIAIFAVIILILFGLGAIWDLTVGKLIPKWRLGVFDDPDWYDSY